MYLSAPFILQNFSKKSYIWFTVMRMCAIFRRKMAHFSWTKFFWYKPLLLLSSTYWLFSLWKILKNSYSGSRIMTMHHFWAQNGPFTPNKFFLENYYYHSHLPISLFNFAKILKKLFQWIQSYEDMQFLCPKWPIFPNENFFKKTC